jgi:hypothetical protein
MIGDALPFPQILAFSVQSSRSGRPDGARRRPMIVANPLHDEEFQALIERFLLDGVAEPRDLEARLRARYPEAVVRRRDLAGENFEVWYVYRDGHWIESEGNG